MRTKILIVTQALGYGIGGSEKALIEMLKAIDTNNYEVTVLSLTDAPEKPYTDERITIIYGNEEYLKACAPLRYSITSHEYSATEKLTKLYASFYTRFHKGDFSSKLWDLYKGKIQTLPTTYDIAIGYGVGAATYFVIDKVNAKAKIAWLNTSLADAHFDLDYCRKYYEHYDAVVADSVSGVKRFTDLYNNFKKSVYAIRNLLDFNELRARGEEGHGFTDKFDGTRILSVGRLTEAKAFHLAVDAAKILKDKGYKFRWYIVGFGSLESQLRAQIEANNLNGIFVLLGAQSNPYPFFKECDIYVQTSIFEGSCITIEEAMAFFKPIVTTDFPAAYEKIVDGENGLITKMEAQSIALGVEKLLRDNTLIKKLTENQIAHPLSYEEEMDKFYSIVKGLID